MNLLIIKGCLIVLLIHNLSRAFSYFLTLKLITYEKKGFR